MKQTSLTSKQQAKYDDGLEVLRLVRNGTSFSQATKMVGINSATAKKKIGNAITKKNNRIIAKKRDTLLRTLKIYENGKEVFVTVKGTANSKKIARYHSALGRRIDNNDKNALNSIRRMIMFMFQSSKKRTHRYYPSTATKQTSWTQKITKHLTLKSQKNSKKTLKKEVKIPFM